MLHYPIPSQQSSSNKAPLTPNWICNNCNSSQKAPAPRYRCTVCYDFDYCQNCQSSGVHHVHPMEPIPINVTANWLCNNCNGEFQAPQDRYRCQVCRDFDLCKDCFYSTPHSHMMDKFPIETSDHWKCDGCKKSCTVANKRFRCIVCKDFDYCADCQSKYHHAHKTERVPKQHHDKYICDVCLKSFTGYQNRWRCCVCTDYDECNSCHQQQKHQHMVLPCTTSDRKWMDDVLFPNDSSMNNMSNLSNNLNINLNISNLPPPQKTDDLSQECVICMTNVKNAVIIHGSTAHQACCLQCANDLKLKNQPCPICRQKIDNVVLNFHV